MADPIENRVNKLESEILKYKKTTIIALVFSILCGGGGLVGLASWISSIPKANKEENKIQVETQKLALEIVKDSLEISMKRFNEIQQKHNSEIESIARQVQLNKSIGNNQQVSSLTTLLINKEKQFQSLIATTTEMCAKLAEEAGKKKWANTYVSQMESIKQESFAYQQQLEQLQ